MRRSIAAVLVVAALLLGVVLGAMLFPRVDEKVVEKNVEVFVDKWHNETVYVDRWHNETVTEYVDRWHNETVYIENLTVVCITEAVRCECCNKWICAGTVALGLNIDGEIVYFHNAYEVWQYLAAQTT